MRRIFYKPMLALIAISLFAAQQRTVFELRLAEREPGQGLTEATVANSDEKVYLHKEAFITSADVVSARAVKSEYSDYYDIKLKFSAEAGERMKRISGQRIGKIIAVLIDGKVVSAPVLMGEIGGEAQITGPIRKEQAEDIAAGITRQ